MTTELKSDLAAALRALDAKKVVPPPPPPENWMSSIPDCADLFLRSSLYVDIPITIWDREILERLRRNQYQFDGYCAACEKESIFRGGHDPSGHDQNAGYGSNSDWMLGGGYFFSQAFCQRCSSVYVFYFVLSDMKLAKIGQLPSLEDLAVAENARFRKLLSKADFADLRRANGLFSHGIGIGSFVYLRRLFEQLIDRHRLTFEQSNGPIDGWEKMRMADRINALRDVLPPAIVTHRAAYSILSAGIHELDEETCRRYFPVVRSAIIQILEQDLQEQQRQAAESQLVRDLADIQTEIGQREQTREA